MYGRQEYMNPVLGSPYGWGYDNVSWGGRMMQRRNPLEELYEQELRVLEGYFRREMELLYRYRNGDGDYFYSAENDARCRFEYEKSRLYERLVNHAHWNIQAQQLEIMKYQMYPTYLLPKETKTVPTETKKFIIISSAGAAEHPTEHKTLAEAEAEATRLAKQFPKQEFIVYATQKSFKVADKPVDVKVYA